MYPREHLLKMLDDEIRHREALGASRQVSAGFIVADLERVLIGMDGFSLHFQGGRPIKQYRIQDLNLRELDELRDFAQLKVQP